MRVLMTVDAVGGVWQYACDLAEALRSTGVEPILALLGPPPSRGQRDELGAATTLIETRLDLDWLAGDAETVGRAGRTIASLAGRLGVDLVHLNQPALAASARFAVPVVATIHSCVLTWWQAVHGGAAPCSFAWQSELVSRGLRRADAVAAPTASFAEAVRRAYALESAPTVVPNGRRPAATGLVAPRPGHVLAAGRLWDRGKDAATLDRVAARLPCRLQAAGAVQGPHGERVELRHIEALGSLGGAELAARFAARPVFVSAALYEPFGLAVLEAAAAGCPLVLADIATLRETWDGAARFVAPRDESGFVAAITALLDNRDLRTQQGERARAQAARFTPARTAAGMRQIYARALAKYDRPLPADVA